MDTNFAGRIRKNTKLAATNGLMPVFEAIVNSIYAINVRGVPGKIEIVINREKSLLESDPQSTYTPDIKGFTIYDNGIGFNEANFKSFNTLDSDAKMDSGGKGIGRILWLVAFDYAHIESRYVENEQQFCRRFDFMPTDVGVENPIKETIPSTDLDEYQTSVRLIGFQDRYRKNTVKSTRAIGRRIVEHCLEYFVLDKAPEIVVRDDYENIAVSLDEIYNVDFAPSIKKQKFKIKNKKFEILHVLRRRHGDTPHQIVFCAHNRAVQSLLLSSRLTHLDEVILNERMEQTAYNAYVSNEILDKTVNGDRTAFDIDHRGALAFSAEEVTWNDIEDGCVAQVEKFLAPHIKEAQEKSMQRIREFIETTENKYRVLLTHRKSELLTIPPNLSDANLDLRLHEILHIWRQEVKRAATEEVESDVTKAFREHKKNFAQIISQLQDLAKSDLAEYVVHRATVLSFLEKILDVKNEGKFEKEEILHGLIFPMRTTSDEVSYDDHNLWILDERLVQHQYLASDLKFSQQKDSPVQVDSENRPDLLIYNRMFAYAPDEGPHRSVVIFEFKRPERNDYAEDEKDPIKQIYGYVSEIQSGKAKRDGGSTIEAPPANTPFYCYLVATLTPRLVEEATQRGFTKMPDGLGYFNYNPNLCAYFEIISPRKLKDDAKTRNRVFVEKLGLKSIDPKLFR